MTVGRRTLIQIQDTRRYGSVLIQPVPVFGAAVHVSKVLLPVRIRARVGEASRLPRPWLLDSYGKVGRLGCARNLHAALFNGNPAGSQQELRKFCIQ